MRTELSHGREHAPTRSGRRRGSRPPLTAAALGLLALRPSAQRRVREEVADVPSDTPAGALDELEHTDAVVRETLRLYPPGPGLFREATTPVTVDGYRIPEGATVAVAPWVTQRDDRWFEDPEQFRPERWLAGDAQRTFPRADRGAAVRDRPEYAHFPFGGGPRHCIGTRFAMAELTVAVATICAHVALDTPMDEMSPMGGGMTLSPDGPIRVTVDR